MRNKIPNWLIAISSVPLAFFGLLSVNVNHVSGAGSSDINISYDEVHPTSKRVLNGTTVFIQLVIDNDGPDSVTSVTIDNQFTNLQFSSSSLGCSTATDSGSFDYNTGVWTGQIDTGQLTCFDLLFTVTGSSGQNVDLQSSIISSVVLGGAENIDPNTSNDTVTDSLSIQEADDMSISSRIVTDTPITTGNTASYEITMSNIGQGRVPVNDDAIYLYVLLPEQASYTSFSDPNAGDGMSLDSCSIAGTGEDMGYTGNQGDFVLCPLSTADNIFDAGDSFSMTINMTADSDFVSGSSFMGAMIMTPAFEFDNDDYDELNAQLGLGTPFLDIDINNITKITYDTSPLSSTINRCSGQPNPTNTDDACFDVTFNKPIYGASFTVNDLIMYGGNVYEFTQQSSTSWKVRVNGLPIGQTFSLSLASGSVTDLSAVQFSGQVLGDNTILYSGSAASVGLKNASELAKTGIFVAIATPVGLFLILGALYTYYDYRRHLAPLYSTDSKVSYSYFHHLNVVTVPEIKYRIKTELHPFSVKRSDQVRHF